MSELSEMISAPTKVDYRNIVEQFAPKLSQPSSITDIREVMLFKSPVAHRGRLVVRIFKRGHNITGLEFGVNPEPPKKNKSSEQEKQYAWYTEDRLLSEDEALCNEKNTVRYADSSRSHKPGTYARLLNSIVRNLGSQIRMVGVHNMIISSAG